MVTKPPLSHALPRLDELVQPWSIPSWIVTQFNELGTSEHLYRRFAAMGLVLNRFFPDDPSELDKFINDEHDVELDNKITIWLMAQSHVELKSLAQLAEQEALNLGTDLGHIESTGWSMHELLLLALSREILECVTVLLRRRGYASNITPLLQSLDRDAQRRIPFPRLSVPSFRPQLLLAVHGMAPNLWWGRILGPVS